MSHSNALLQPFVLGSLTLPNRVVMAPMTRNFSPGNVPGDDVVEYYRLRAGEFDLVAVGRALIANPDWVQLVRSDSLPKMKAFRKEDLATLA